MSASSKTGYINGSDMLLYVGSKAIGHCSSHSVTFNSETKDHAVKPAASAAISAGLWKGKSVTGLSISISADGVSFYTESEGGFKESIALWKAGQAVTVKCMERESTDPYLEGSFVIKSITQNAPAQDDVTYSLSLENNGEPTTFDTTKLT